MSAPKESFVSRYWLHMMAALVLLLMALPVEAHPADQGGEALVSQTTE